MCSKTTSLRPPQPWPTSLACERSSWSRQTTTVFSPSGCSIFEARSRTYSRYLTRLIGPCLTGATNTEPPPQAAASLNPIGSPSRNIHFVQWADERVRIIQVARARSRSRGRPFWFARPPFRGRGSGRRSTLRESRSCWNSPCSITWHLGLPVSQLKSPETPEAQKALTNQPETEKTT